MAREISAMVVSRVLSLRSTPIMPSGGVYADQIKFDFDPEWDGYTKKAVFKRSESAIYPMYLDAENTCHIPPEAIKTDGTLQIGVVGTKDDDTYGTSTLTSTYAKYQIVDGACMEIAVEDPTPTVYEEIMDLLTTLEGKITELEGAVRYDAAQALTDAQQAQARSNIGVSDSGGGTIETLSAEKITFDGLISYLAYPDDIASSDNGLQIIQKLRAMIRYGCLGIEAQDLSDEAIATMQEKIKLVPDGTTIISKSDGTISAGVTWYGTCATAAVTATKTVDMTGFARQTGSMVCIKFTYGNTASSPTLNVGGSGASSIYNCYTNTNVTSNDITANMVANLVFDGTRWVLLNPAIPDGDNVRY